MFSGDRKIHRDELDRIESVTGKVPLDEVCATPPIASDPTAQRDHVASCTDPQILFEIAIRLEYLSPAGVEYLRRQINKQDSVQAIDADLAAVAHTIDEDLEAQGGSS